MSSKVTCEEKEILENMFGGDKSRDASSTIRGFLFQDLVVIESLLDDSVEYVCSEYLEDVDVFYKDGTFKFIQVKYYPCTNPKMEEIMTDLYYQYLRLFLLKSKLVSKPLLIIHRPHNVISLDFEKMQSIVNPGATEEPKEVLDFKKWLIDNIYILTKEQQKKTLFSKFAYESSIRNFLDKFEIVKKSNIKDFQSELEQKLVQIFPGTGLYRSNEKQKKILIGLAISYVQRRYKVEKPNFDTLCINREEFCKEIEKSLQEYDDEHIVAYLKSIALQVMGEVVRYNENLSENQVKIINTIYLKTLDWLSDMGSDVQGQFQLVNTLSDNSIGEMQEFTQFDIMNRLILIAECQKAIKQFLKYFWKIIFDICLDKVDFDIHTDEDMMNPKTYIVSDEIRYICLHFPNDCVDTSVILSANQEAMRRSRRNLCSRMMEAKPQKWFLKGNEAGKYDYSYSTAEIRQENVVTYLDADSFVIECMNCIKVDDDEWSVNDNCGECIFSRTCYERKE